MTRLLFIILFLWTSKTFGCSCNFYGDFLETISGKENKLVIGQIIGLDDYFYKVRVDSVINGTLTSDTINLMSGNGGNCWKILMQSDIGKSFIFNLSNLSNDSIQYYGLLECGTSRIKIIGNTLQGRISGGTFQNQVMLLSDFLEIYERKHPSKHYKINDLTTNETFELNGTGQRIGKWKIVGYANLVIEEGRYDNSGKKNGEWKYYLIKSQKINGRYQHETSTKKLVTYNHGRIKKVSRYYDLNGKKLNPGKLKKGTGQLLEYYDNGELCGKYTYINGIKDGKAELYKNGYTIKGYYKNGQREGTWETFENDVLVLKEIYEDGQIKEEIWIE